MRNNSQSKQGRTLKGSESDMQTYKKILCGMLLAWTWMESGAYAQAPNSAASGMWDNVKRVPKEESIRVKLHNGKKHQGSLKSVSDTGLTVEHWFAQGSETVEVHREEIRKVFRLHERDRSHDIAKWIGVGIGIGTLIAVGVSQPSETRNLGPRNIPGYMIAGVAGGFIGGQIKPDKRKVLIYDSRLLKSLSKHAKSKDTPTNKNEGTHGAAPAHIAPENFDCERE